MPPAALAGALLAGVSSAGLSVLGAGAAGVAGITFLGLTGWSAVAAQFGAAVLGSLAMGAISQAMQPRAATGTSFSAQAAARTQSIRSPIASRRIVYGTAMVGGVMAFAASAPSGGVDDDLLYLVHVLAAHRSEQIVEAWFNDTRADDGAWSATGRFAGHVGFWPVGDRVSGIVQDQPLIDAGVGWTAAHRGDGLTWLRTTLQWGADGAEVFPTGIPNHKCLLKGKLVYDPRSGLTAWSDNWALCVRDYLVTPAREGGLGASADEIDEASFIAAANASDEPVDIPGGGTQARYTCNGVIDCGQTPARIVEDLLTAGAGILVYQQGKYRLHAGVATAATAALSESDLRGPIEIVTRRPKSELANAVRGTFVDPDKSWQPADFPEVRDQDYEDEDGERIDTDIELPFTTDSYRAQRIAKIHLEAIRQGISVRMPCKLTALGISAGDVVELTIARFGWSAKKFRVTRRQFAGTELGIDLELREYADAIYAWSDTDATEADAAPNTNLPRVHEVAAPQIVSVAESLAETRSGAGVAARATVAWGASTSGFVTGYLLQWRLSSDSDWNARPVTGALTDAVSDLVPGLYEFRVRAFNTFGAKSPWSSIVTKELFGLTAPPSDMTGLAMVPQGATAHFRWDQSPDLDVRIGGRVALRHSPALTGATWAESVEVPGAAIPGAATESAQPLLAGTYLLKFVDSSGNYSSGAASVVTTAPEALRHDNLVTIDESATWGGSKTDTVVADGNLQLDSEGLIDDWGMIDDVALWDAGDGVKLSGSYAFAATQDLGANYQVRLTANLEVLVFNALDLIDARTAPIDEWDSIDGIIAGSAANAVLEFRATPDDPAGAPVWGAWTPFLVADAQGRGFQFRLLLSTSDPANNIRVEECQVTIDVPEEVQSGSIATSSVGDVTIVFPQGFAAAPAMGFTFAAQAGDDPVRLVSVSATQAVIAVYNAGSRVVRTVEWVANGFGLAS